MDCNPLEQKTLSSRIKPHKTHKFVHFLPPLPHPLTILWLPIVMCCSPTNDVHSLKRNFNRSPQLLLRAPQYSRGVSCRSSASFAHSCAIKLLPLNGKICSTIDPCNVGIFASRWTRAQNKEDGIKPGRRVWLKWWKFMAGFFVFHWWHAIQAASQTRIHHCRATNPAASSNRIL